VLGKTKKTIIALARALGYLTLLFWGNGAIPRWKAAIPVCSNLPRELYRVRLCAASSRVSGSSSSSSMDGERSVALAGGGDNYRSGDRINGRPHGRHSPDPAYNESPFMVLES
jgi:hypothetical protein